jgi:hypothetical protein
MSDLLFESESRTPSREMKSLSHLICVPQKRRWIDAESSAPYIDTNKNNIGTI